MIDIDFVIPWVDGADPVWADSYRQYAHLEDKRFNVSGERFRDWGLLRFWFRAVAKYAPWVRTIHFVSCGQVPTWLNKEHPQLHLVKHEDYLPARFLPTFCANPIELSFHRIEGLSEHFVYFNDDMFLSAPVQPSDFFKNGLPRETAIRSHLLPSEFGHIVLNDINLINKYLDFYSLYRKNLRKWFNARYGLQGLKNFLFIPYKDFTGMRESHLPYTLRKSTFEAVWQKCGKELEETSLRKFRSIMDVNVWLIKYWQVVSGEFFPQNRHFGRLFSANETDRIRRVLQHRSFKTICINDQEWKDITAIKESLLLVFENVFPDRCSFERDA